MTVKEFLQLVRRQDKAIRTCEQELKETRARAFMLSSPAFGDKVQGNHVSSLDDVVISLEQQAQKVKAKWEQYACVRNVATDLIGTETDADRKIALYRYYIMCETWPDVAAALHVSLRTAYTFHGRGLQDLAKVWPAFEEIYNKNKIVQ